MQGLLARLRPDFWLGVALTAIGAWAAGEAWGFDRSSWTYPFTLSLALAALGLTIAVRVLAAPAADNSLLDDPRPIAKAAIPGAVVLGLWAWSLSQGIGYLIPSALAAAALAWIAGVRAPARIAAYGVATAAGVFLLFGILFNTPLPLLAPVRALIG